VADGRGRGRGTPVARLTGAGRLIVAVYALFAVAAVSRSAYQIATKFDLAPVAYSLSALAAAVYVVATIALARSGAGARRLAAAALTFELTGVLIVGALSLALPSAFPDASVWSGFGVGYLYLPLVLPIAGLIWIGLPRLPHQPAPDLRADEAP